MKEVLVSFNNENYLAKYNSQTDYYELELKAPSIGGIYDINIKYTDVLSQKHEKNIKVQILEKEKIKLETNKNFIWIFDHKDFSVKDIVEISDYELIIDEETNDTSTINITKKIPVKKNDIVAYKKNNVLKYLGVIKEVSNNNGELLYKYILKYITNIFDLEIKLEDEQIIKDEGLEDFIAKSIDKNFINNVDSFINKKYIEINVKTHTKKQISVSNVIDKIYNLHTWMTNCTQLYDIVYDIYIQDNKLIIDIENKSYDKELIDVQAQNISNYSETFETNIISKVTVVTSTSDYSLYLLNDRNTTEDMNDENRADGNTKTVYTEKYEDARQKAIDTFKANSYNHKISFNMIDKEMKIGTPISIKTKDSIIYDTYISAIKVTPGKFIEYTCGNIRTKFIEKILKERK